MFEPSLWSKLHGASTHFPIALILVAALCDVASLVWRNIETRRRFRFAATLTLLIGTLGAYAAVISGLVVTKGVIWGHETMLRHHQFVWPSFALMTGLAAWRLVSRHEPSRRSEVIQVVLLCLTAALVGAAGYWGGELFSEG